MVLYMKQKQIFMTEDDHKRLAGIVRAMKASSRKAGHLAALERELERASVVPSHMIPGYAVTMNSRVRFTDLSTGELNECTLVFPGSADAAENRISILAPIGAALIGETQGSEVEYEAPGGIMRLRVEQVVFQPEAEDSVVQ